MHAKLLILRGKAAVVAWKDGTGWQAAIVSSEDLPADVLEGQLFQIDAEVLETGTEYGIDWNVILPEDVFTVDMLQHALRNHGIWTLEEYLQRPDLVRDAIGTVVSKIHVRMQEAVIAELNR